MKVKIWEVVFGYNYARVRVSAENCQEAIKKARKKVPEENEKVTKVELIAEED